MNSEKLCPFCAKELWLMSTTNQWHLYCHWCDVRFNDDLQPMKGATDAG